MLQRIIEWKTRESRARHLAAMKPRTPNRAERRQRQPTSWYHAVAREGTKAQRRAFGGWPSMSRPGHASVR